MWCSGSWSVCRRVLRLYRWDAVLDGGNSLWSTWLGLWISLLKSCSSASAHISSNVTFLSEYPSFQQLRRNELSFILSPAVQYPNNAEAAYAFLEPLFGRHLTGIIVYSDSDVRPIFLLIYYYLISEAKCLFDFSVGVSSIVHSWL